MRLPAGYFRPHTFWWRPLFRPGHLFLLFPGALWWRFLPPTSYHPTRLRRLGKQDPWFCQFVPTKHGDLGPTATLKQTNSSYLPASLRWHPPPLYSYKHTQCFLETGKQLFMALSKFCWRKKLHRSGWSCLSLYDVIFSLSMRVKFSCLMWFQCNLWVKLVCFNSRLVLPSLKNVSHLKLTLY